MGSYTVRYLSSDRNDERYLQQGYRRAKKSRVNDKRSEFSCIHKVYRHAKEVVLLSFKSNVKCGRPVKCKMKCLKASKHSILSILCSSG